MYIFLFIFLLSRVLIGLELLKNNLLINLEINNYINNNFLELFLFNHTIPNGHLLLEKLISLLGSNNSLFFYLLNITYTLLFCYFLNDLIRRFSIKKIYRLIILISISTVLLPYETWRLDHHDHINLFLISYIFWSIFYFINYNRKFNHLILSLILINFFYTLGFIYTISIFFVLIFFSKKFNLKLSRNYYLKFTSVFIIIFCIFFKNYTTISIFSPTSMGGANLIQRTIHAIGEEKYKILLEKKKDAFPEWWTILTNEIFKSNKKIDLVDLRISNLAHANLDKDIFLNFQKQKIVINRIENLNSDIILILEKDLENLKNNKSLYEYGYQQNLLSTVYQSYGSKIFIETCKTYPAEILIGNFGNKGILLTTFQMISHAGIFPNYYEPNIKYSNTLIELFNNIMRILITIILLLSPIILIKKIKFKTINKKDFYYLILLFFLSLITFFTSVITCCENPRMFVMQFFLISLICVMNISYIFKIKVETNK